jgi:hypothetical protein
MATSFEKLIYTAVTNAMRGIPPAIAASSNAEIIAQTLFPEVSQSVSESAAADEYKRSLLRREKSLTLVAGEATLPDDVLLNFIADAELINSNNISQRYAWRDYPDFVKRGDRRIGIFTLQAGTTFQVIAPNVGFSIPLTTTGSYLLTTPCSVEIPAVYTDPVDAPSQIISDLTEALSNAIRGELTKVAGQAA